MRQIIDRELGGYANIFDSAEEILKSAENPRGNSRFGSWKYNKEWVGAEFSSWSDVRKKVRCPWAEGSKTVESFQSKMDQRSLPQPESKTRRHRWSEEDGDVSSDRLLAGEAEFYRETYRSHKTGTQNITIISHLGGSCDRDSDNLFLATAATIAVVDILEAAGFSCEIWGYAWCTKAWENSGKMDKWMLGLRMKESGDPLDIDSLIAISSGWFYRSACIASMDDLAHHYCTDNYGYPQRDISQWIKYLDVGNSIVVEMPDAHSEQQALSNAQKMLASIISANLEN